MTPAATMRMPTRRRWLALGAVFALGTAVVGADAALKRAPHAGFVLPDADLTLATANLPAAWATLEDSPAFTRIRSVAPQIYQQLGLASRHRTGIRWTPVRWYVWFGRPTALSVSQRDWVMCCRPGLLLRAARALGLLDATAWRTGFLLIGSAQPIVDALARDGVSVEDLDLPQTVAISWRRDPAGEAEIDFSGDWSVRGVVEMREVEIDVRLARRRADTWPGDPTTTLFVSRTEIIDQLLPTDWPAFPFSAELERAWEEFCARLPAEWDASAESYQFALGSVDMRGVVPVPELGVILRPDAPFAPLNAPPRAIPYVWGVTSGWMEPWLGEPLSLYSASDRRIRVFVNQEPTMSRLLDEPLTGRNVPYDARLEADFDKIAEIAQRLVRIAAREHLLPAYSEQDVEHEITPYIEAIGELGRLTVEGRLTGGQLEFAGEFKPPAHTEEASET